MNERTYHYKFCFIVYFKNIPITIRRCEMLLNISRKKKYNLILLMPSYFVLFHLNISFFEASIRHKLWKLIWIWFLFLVANADVLTKFLCAIIAQKKCFFIIKVTNFLLHTDSFRLGKTFISSFFLIDKYKIIGAWMNWFNKS